METNIKNQLYTFILDFKGGTYISQFRGSSPEEALQNWIARVEIEPIQGLKEKHRVKLQESFDEDGFVPIDTVANVWCYSFLLKRNSGLLNFVCTSED